MKKTFQIGNFCFSLSYPNEIVPPPNFMLFEKPDGKAEYSYTINIAEFLPAIDGQVIAKRPDIEIYSSNGFESRLIGIKGKDSYYAYYSETSDVSAEITLSVNEISGLHIDPVFTSLLVLERRLIRSNALILHCAYIKYNGRAILFSAPSETGKTTQANLWKKHRNSETVNGDRALLQRIDNNWFARGWPVCGTSEDCCNEDTPIRAIVMLSQGTEDNLSILSPITAFSQLYSQITVNTWNKDFVQRNTDLIAELVQQVPVYHLSCTISENAVKCLESALYN